MAADFAERMLVRPGSAVDNVFIGLRERLLAKGATFVRASYEPGSIAMEGWKLKPQDQGAVPEHATIAVVEL